MSDARTKEHTTGPDLTPKDFGAHRQAQRVGLPPVPRQGGHGHFEPRIARRKLLGTVFVAVCLGATLIALAALALLLGKILYDGLGALSWRFLTSFPSRFAAIAGIKPALVGTAWILGLTAALAFPLGVATAIWLEEYAPNNWLKRAVQTNIANLAGVPAIVYGLLGLAVFVRGLALGRSILAGAMTLALLSLPVIIIASQESIRAVPNSFRLGSYALGATRWQTVRHHVLPHALPGMLTGTILALSRAVGEAAPLLVVGALAFVPFVPTGVKDEFTVLPIQIFNWISRPQPEFHALAAAASLVLMAILLSLNAIAIFLRNRYSRKY
jgi:phosphate transport system permease protein